MCGRYTLTQDQEALQVALGIEGLIHPRPRYNVAPSQEMPALIRGEDGAAPARLRWGLIPSWARDPAIANRLINARAETAHSKPSFRSAFRSGRCLIPADGFFEWLKGPGGKRPFRVHLESEEPFTLAGLAERWESPSGEVIETFTILTTDASESISGIHPRMPVILAPEERDPWLNPSTDPDRLRALLRPYPDPGPGHPGALAVQEVSTRVNSPAHDDPGCLAPPSPPGHDLPLFRE